jgi:hypothetical protein
MTLLPAYGRDYRNKIEVLSDWENGKDFVIAGPLELAGHGTYVNKTDYEKYPALKSRKVFIRYWRKTKIVEVTNE